MRALLPVYCRLLGYFVIALALFLPFLMLMLGKMTDSNLLFYKECSKLLMMLGALMILFAYTKNENKETEQVRNTATRNAMFLTVLFIFGGMLYRLATPLVARTSVTPSPISMMDTSKVPPPRS